MKVDLETKTRRIACEWPSIPHKGDFVVYNGVKGENHKIRWKVKRVTWLVNFATREPIVKVELR